jgi:Alkyl sulfatase and related hydrolases
MTITLKKLTDQVYVAVGDTGPASSANRGFNSNAGFVITKAGVVVFDTLGTPVLGEALVQAIRQVTDQPIKLVIVSHYHADHFYGLQAFKAQGAEIWADIQAKNQLGTDLFKERLKQRQRDLFPTWMSIRRSSQRIAGLMAIRVLRWAARISRSSMPARRTPLKTSCSGCKSLACCSLATSFSRAECLMWLAPICVAGWHR